MADAIFKVPNNSTVQLQDSTKLPLTGGTLTGNLTLQWGDLVLGTASTASNDSGDIVWTYGNGNEKARISEYDSPTSPVGPKYRIFSKSNASSAMYDGNLTINYVASKGYDTWTSQSVVYSNNGSVILYKFGCLVTFKVNGIKLKANSTGRTHFLTIDSMYRPIAQVQTGRDGWGTSSNAWVQYIIGADGKVYVDIDGTLPNDKQSWLNFSYVTSNT